MKAAAAAAASCASAPTVSVGIHGTPKKVKSADAFCGILGGERVSHKLKIGLGEWEGPRGTPPRVKWRAFHNGRGGGSL